MPGKTPTVKRRLSGVVAKAMRRFAVPGAAVGIVHDGDEHSVALGVTSLEFPLEIDPQTLFQIGSTTKTYTGTVLTMLVEEGKLDLDAPVQRYLPQFKLPDADAASQVKVRHLVTHTAGFLGDYFDDLGRGDDALRRIVRRMAKRTPQLTPVGATWSYNNAGFYVAGRLIEELTRKRYEDVIKERILDPLGMERTFFFAEDVITHKTAIGHQVLADGTTKIARPWGLARALNPAGGLVSNVDDQLRYARFHLGDGRAPDGTRLLQAASVKRMRAPLAPAGTIADEVGVTWLLERIGRTQIAKHGGSINGHMSEFLLVPAKGFGITVLTNGSRGHELGRVVLDWALAELLGLRRPEPRFRPLGAKAAAAYAGRYATPWGHLVTSVDNGGLLLTMEPSQAALDAEPDLAAALPPPLPLAFAGRDLAYVRGGGFIEGSRVEFLRGDRGEVAWVRHGARIYRRED